MRKLIIALAILLNGFSVLALDIPNNRPGWAERSPEFSKWLTTSVRIMLPDQYSGSGTMVYYDDVSNLMYVLSAGHLLRNEGRFHLKSGQKSVKIGIDVFYHNGVQLQKPERYPGEIIAFVWGNERNIYDVAVYRFRPAWKNPCVSPIAPLGYKLTKNKWYHSCGSDDATDAAHYWVTFAATRQIGEYFEYWTRNNGPRGGRSGGGLFTDDGMLVGICSRGYEGADGLWSSLEQIHRFLQEENLGFIANGTMARRIPIIDMSGEQQKYNGNYIPIPHLEHPEIGVSHFQYSKPSSK